MFWEAFFMLVILKIPVAYLCAVVWWAIKAEPRPLEGVARVVPLDPEPQRGCDWRRRHVRAIRPRPPRGGRTRVAVARARPVG